MHRRNRWGELFLVFFMLGSFHRHSCYFKMWDECCLCSDKTLFLLCLSDFYSLVVLRLVWVVIRKRTVLTIHLTICQTFLHFQVLLFLLHVYPFIVSVIKTRRTRISLSSLSCWPLLISRHVFFFSCLTFFTSLLDLTWETRVSIPVCLSQYNQQRQEIHCLSWDFILPFVSPGLIFPVGLLDCRDFLLSCVSKASFSFSLFRWHCTSCHKKERRRVSIGSSFPSSDLTSDVISSGRDKREVSEVSAKRAFNTKSFEVRTDIKEQEFTVFLSFRRTKRKSWKHKTLTVIDIQWRLVTWGQEK